MIGETCNFPDRENIAKRPSSDNDVILLPVVFDHSIGVQG
jgi:hypothetical protein